MKLKNYGAKNEFRSINIAGSLLWFCNIIYDFLVIENNSKIDRYNCNYTCFPLQTIICDSEHAGCSDNTVHKLKLRK